MGRVKAPEAPPKRRSTRHRPTDEQLLDAGLAVVADLGLERTTMEAIAERADTTKVTLYAHYGSREGLLGAIVEREVTALTQWMFEAYDRGEQQSHVNRSTRPWPPCSPTRSSTRSDFGCSSASNTGGRRDRPRTPWIGPEVARCPGTTRRAGDAEFLPPTRAQPRPSADILAAMTLGAAIDGARQAVIVHNLAPEVTSELAETLIGGLLGAVDIEQFRSVDRKAAKALRASAR